MFQLTVGNFTKSDLPAQLPTLPVYKAMRDTDSSPPITAVSYVKMIPYFFQKHNSFSYLFLFFHFSCCIVSNCTRPRSSGSKSFS